MRAPQTNIDILCAELDRYQRQLCLKDNGTNTEDILFLLRRFEHTKSQILSTTDPIDALTILFDLIHDPKIRPLMDKYGLK